MTFSNKQTILYVIMILSVLITVCAPFVGMHTISFRAILDSAGHGMAHDIFWRIRVPRVCAAFVAGAGLSVSGMVFQAMFRNLLATPFTMGVASGASLGAAIFVHLGGTMTLWCYSGVSLAAFSGALVSIGLVYGLSGIRRQMPAATMLLAGVAVSFFFSSLILFIQYMSSFSHSFQIVRWLMGAIDIVGFGAITTMLPVVAAGSALILFLTRELNLLMAGEDFSISRGVGHCQDQKITFPGRISHRRFDCRNMRPHRLCRYDGTAYLPVDDRCRPSLPCLGVTVFRRGFSCLLRHPGPHHHRACANAGGHHHGTSGRAVLYLASGKKRFKTCAVISMIKSLADARDYGRGCYSCRFGLYKSSKFKIRIIISRQC